MNETKKSLLLEMKMLAEDKAPKHSDIINEGIKFFRTSKKLETAIAKAEAGLERAKTSDKLDKEDLKKLSGVIKRLKMAKTEFAKAEELFTTGGEKKIAKEKYNILKKKYSDIYKDLGGMKGKLIAAGVFTAIAGAAALFVMSITPANAGAKYPNFDYQNKTALDKFFSDVNGAFKNVGAEIEKIGDSFEKARAKDELTKGGGLSGTQLGHGDKPGHHEKEELTRGGGLSGTQLGRGAGSKIDKYL